MEDDEFNYIFHLTRDTFKLDEDDCEHFYCKYCEKIIKIRYIDRHNKKEHHNANKSSFKQRNMTEQIYIRLVNDFEAGKYDPNDVNLVGLEKVNRFKQLEKVCQLSEHYLRPLSRWEWILAITGPVVKINIFF